MRAQAASDGFEVRDLVVDGVAVLAVAGELDLATVPELRSRLQAVVERGADRLVVDLTGVPFLDSVALAALVTARHRLPAGAMAVVADPGSYVMLIVEVAGLDAVFPIVHTLDQAIACVREAR